MWILKHKMSPPGGRPGTFLKKNAYSSEKKTMKQNFMQNDPKMSLYIFKGQQIGFFLLKINTFGYIVGFFCLDILKYALSRSVKTANFVK